MSFKKALIVYRKELMEMLRDKRTLFTTIILPVVMYPLLFMGFSAIMSRQTDVLEKRGATIAFRDSLQIRSEANLAVRDTIYNNLRVIRYFTVADRLPEADKLYAENDIQAIVTLTDTLVAGQSSYVVHIRYDGSGERGQLIYKKIEKSLQETADKIVVNRLQERNVDPELIKPIQVNQRDSASAQKKMGSFLGMFLPYIMILTLVAGAATIAADLVAGEKERKTLETLLVSSATRSEIVMGKYLTIITMAMINVLINLVSLSFSVRYLLSQTGLDTQAIQMPVKAFAVLFVAMIPLATLFAALLLSISTFSRNMKEARTYEQPIMMVSMLLGMISFIPSVEINTLLALIPVVNISLLFKAVMIDEYLLSHLLLTVGSTLLLDIVAIWATVKLFNTESVLFRTEEEPGLKQALKRNQGLGLKTGLLTPYYGLVYYALALAALFFIGGKLQSADLVKGLFQTQILIILLPVLLFLSALRLKPRELLRLKAPRLGELALVPFIAVSASVLVTQLTHLVDLVFPIPADYIEKMSQMLKLGERPMWLMLGVFALAPGICEEILFRGFLSRFFEKYGPVLSVVIVGFLFGLFHLDPFKLVQASLLGMLLGYLTLRSGSIYNSMLSHFINNALAICLVNLGNPSWLQPLVTADGNFRLWTIAPMLAVLSGSLWMFHKITAPKEVR